MNTCIAEGCDKAIHVKKRGLCRSHYDKMIYSQLSYDLNCQTCGIGYQSKAKHSKYCSWCKNLANSASKSPENIGIYTALRTGTRQDVLDAIRDRCIVTEAGCWEWQGYIRQNGYGAVSTGRDKTTAQELTHRLTYEYATGIKPTGMSVHHKCSNLSCCNPEHLQLATQRDNMAEMHARKSYEAQINELRKALALLAPDHPLLKA